MATINNIYGKNYDITYYANDEFNEAITITDENGNAVDLSLKTVVFTVRKKKTDSAAIMTLSTESPSTAVLTISGATGSIGTDNVVTFSGTYDLDERAYYYDLTNTTDNLTLLYGLLIVTKNVHA